MNTDIRLSVGFWQHPKTKKTVKRLGLEGVRSLQVLWLWAAQNRPDGNLSGMDEEAIELAADWQGEEGLFFSTCAGMWIDQTEAGYALHDWAEHNPWQAEAEARSEAAKKAAAARWGNADAIKAHKGKHAPAMREQCGGNADAIKAQCPSSFPDPKPKPEEKSKIQKTPCQVFAEDSEAYRLAAYMQETLKANVPTLKEPDLQKWAKDFDVALRNDERMSEPRFVAQVIRWACSDSFWRANTLQYEFAADSYSGMDLSIMAAHLLEKERIIDWAYQKNPDSIIWAVRSDGALLGLTYQAEHQISAWHRHDTQGKFKAVCSIPNGFEHSLFAVVERDGAHYLVAP